MKKTYISPLAEVVKTEMEQMICQSSFTLGETITDSDPGFEKASAEDFSAIFEGLW